MAAVIGYNNLLTDVAGAVITVSSEATGFLKENAYDWITADWWKASSAADLYLYIDCLAAVPCDYLGVYGHNAYSASGGTGKITLYYSDTGVGGPWTLLVDAVVGSDNCYIKTFTAVTKRYYRFSFYDGSTFNSAPYAAAISFGARLDLPYGMQPGFGPPLLSYEDEITNQQSINGNFLGRTIKRQGVKFTIDMPPVLTPAWVRTYWSPFIDKAKIRPFFFNWDNTNYPLESVFCWAVGKIKPPVYESQNMLKVSLDCEGLYL